MSLPARVFAAALILGAAGCGDGDSPSAALPYADTGWRTLHANPSNDKHVPVRVAAAYERAWHALQGAALLASPTVGPEGHLYQTTGQAPGHSTLHALDPATGVVLWETEPWTDAADFDDCAVLQSPIVDRDGDLYVSDCNQLWAFHADGQVKWQIGLPAAPPGAAWQDLLSPFNPFVTGVFTRDGSVFGVTAFGQAVAVSRDDGSLRAPVIQLPGGFAPPVTDPPLPPGAFSGGFLDPTLVEPMWQLAFAGIVISANTPAVVEATGRILVVATSTRTGGSEGALYGIDLVPPSGDESGRIEIAFAAPIGPGSGSSPSVSPDGLQVYVSDNTGILYAVSTRSGEVLWSTPSGSEAGSATVGPDGRVYVLQRGRAVNAFDADGSHAWEADLTDLASSLLPTNPTLGAPGWTGSGPATITNDALLIPVQFGYYYEIAGRRPLMPVKVGLVALDPATGQPLRTLADEADTSEGFTVIGKERPEILATHGALVTSSVAVLAPLVDPLLTDGLTVMPPVGGLEAFRPTERSATNALSSLFLRR